MLDDLLRTALDLGRDRPVLEARGTWTTAGELERLVARLATGLVAAGLEPGDRVAMLLPNAVESVACYLACFRAGFVVVPLDERHRPPQIGHALVHSGAALLIVHHDRVAELDAAGILATVGRVVVVGAERPSGRRIPFESILDAEGESPHEPPAEDAVAAIIYTSGTTSRPKGVILTRGALATGVRKYLARVTLGQDDVTLITAPITRPMALRSQLLPALGAGGRVSLLERFEVAGCLAALRRPPAKTFVALLPAALGQLIADPGFAACDFSRLRLCLAGGDRIPVRLQEAFAAVTGVPLTEQCGSSETGPYALNPPFGRKKPGSIGLPAHGVHVAVVDERGHDLPPGRIGEFVVSGPAVMDGYWNDSATTLRTLRRGWVWTGDLGRVDEDGYLWFVGRKRDLIVRGGSNVSPPEVEAALAEHPDVLECCVIGVPDDRWGQAVHAYVVLRSGSRAAAEELWAFLGSRLAEHMVPERFHPVARLPLKGPGKVDRDLLRMQAIVAPLVERVPFFRDAGPEFARAVVPHLESRRFAKGDVLFEEGAAGDEMFFLTQGQVEVLLGTPPEAIAVLREGTHFGEVAVLRDVPRTATVRALTDGEVYALGREGVLHLVDAHPEFGRHMAEVMRHYVALPPGTA